MGDQQERRSTVLDLLVDALLLTLMGILLILIGVFFGLAQAYGQNPPPTRPPIAGTWKMAWSGSVYRATFHPGGGYEAWYANAIGPSTRWYGSWLLVGNTLEIRETSGICHEGEDGYYPTDLHIYVFDLENGHLRGRSPQSGTTIELIKP